MFPFFIILGSMQDGGLPHAGCRCAVCQRAWVDPTVRRWAAGAAIIDPRTDPAGVWLLDATPDIKFQLNLLAEWLGPHPQRPFRLRQPDAIFLTHAHMGHIGGLPQLSMEAMAVAELPLYASPRLNELLRTTALWQPLVEQLDFQPLLPDTPVSLAPDLQLTPFLVPHRDEWGSGTYGFAVAGPRRRLLYIPDIDDWAAWEAGPSWLATADIACVDGSFYSLAELNGRPPVAHPLIEETLIFWKTLGDSPPELYFTHLNHTNPLLRPASTEGEAVRHAGARVVRAGDRWFV